MLPALLLMTLTSTPTPAPPPPPSAQSVNIGIGDYRMETGKISAQDLEAQFKKHVFLQSVQNRAAGYTVPAPWNDFVRISDETTYQTMLRAQPVWRYTDNDGNLWVYSAPGFKKTWPSKVLRISGLTTFTKYAVVVSAYCVDQQTACQIFIEENKTLPAPRPTTDHGDVAYQQWLKRVAQEPCSSRPVNMSPPKYPPNVLRDGIGGTVRIGFVYNRCGNVRDAWVVGSSGNRDLDRAAWNEAFKWQIDIEAVPENQRSGIAVAPVVFAPE